MNFNFLRFIFGSDDNAGAHKVDTPLTVINPSTCLPMIDGEMGGVDVGGSPFGMDVHSGMSDSFMGSMDSNPWE